MAPDRIRRQAARFRALAATERDRAASEPDARWRRLHETGAAKFDQCAADLEQLAGEGGQQLDQRASGSKN
jgi:hypothetical protein